MAGFHLLQPRQRGLFPLFFRLATHGTPAGRLDDRPFEGEYPTEKGLAVYDTVKDKKIADVEMTATWENTLARIETGEVAALSFHRDIEVYTRFFLSRRT